MARYNGRLHCIVGVLPTCYKRKAATYFYPPGGTGPSSLGHLNVNNKKVTSKKDISNTLADAFSKNSSSENYTEKLKNIKQQMR